MPWKPAFPGERPTLGWYAIGWMRAMLAAPDSPVYMPYTPTKEQAEFLLEFYELDPVTGKRLVYRGVLSRPRGWGKSPFAGAICLLEGLGDVYPAGWNAQGRPVGRPWRTVRTPHVHVAAATEPQTENAWAPLLEMLDGTAPVFDHYPALEPMGMRVNLPGYGAITPVTTSGTSLKGKKPVFTLADQTEQWTAANGAARVFKIMLNNAAKLGGSLLETPNAYVPGVGSQAEQTAATARNVLEGRNRKLSTGFLYDHREAPPDTDLTDEESLIYGLRYAYGCSSAHPDGCVIHDPPCAPGWVDLGPIRDRIYQLDADEQESRRDWLNQVTHAQDAWLSGPEWKARGALFLAERGVSVRGATKGDLVALGFDGSRGKAKGKPDATALVASRLSDGYTWPLGIWEAGDDTRVRDAETGQWTWASWQPPIVEIEATLAAAFEEYHVAAFYADPARDWRSHVNAWEALYGQRVQVKVSSVHPFEWWMSGGRSIQVERAVESAEAAVRNGEMVHSDDPLFTLHVLNSRRRFSHQHLRLGKDNDFSPHKIDAAVAYVLAWQARLDALTAGAAIPRKREAVVIKVR